jgi:hypothetical protein
VKVVMIYIMCTNFNGNPSCVSTVGSFYKTMEDCERARFNNVKTVYLGNKPIALRKRENSANCIYSESSCKSVVYSEVENESR